MYPFSKLTTYFRYIIYLKDKNNLYCLVGSRNDRQIDMIMSKVVCCFFKLRKLEFQQRLFTE